MNALPEAHPAMPTTHLPAPLHRFVLAWAVMIGGLVGFWCCRPWLGTTAFNSGSSSSSARRGRSPRCSACRPGVGAVHASEVSGLLRLDRHAAEAVSRGPADRRRCPDSHVSGIVLNAVTGAVLLWLVPRLLPAGTPWAIRFWIALVGFSLPVPHRAVRFLGADLPRDGLRGREALGLPDRRDDARRFLGQALEPHRPGVLAGGRFPPRGAAPAPRSRSWPCSSTAACTTKCVSFMAGSGYGGPTLYFLLQCLGVAIENTRPARRLLRGRLWLARAWTFAVVVLPVGLFLHPGLVDGYLVPMLVAGGVPGLER